MAWVARDNGMARAEAWSARVIADAVCGCACVCAASVHLARAAADHAPTDQSPDAPAASSALLPAAAAVAAGTLLLWQLLQPRGAGVGAKRWIPYKALKEGGGSSCEELAMVVDCSPPRHGVPCITHHKGTHIKRQAKAHPGWPALKGDSSTALVLDAIAQRHPLFARCSPALVSCNHFDIDGLLAAWSAMHPSAALEKAELIAACAHIGDFRELRMPGAAHGGGAPATNGNGAGERDRSAWRATLLMVATMCIPPQDEDDDGDEDDEASGDGGDTVWTRALKICCWLNTQERLHFSRPFETPDEDDKYEHFLPRLAAVLEDPGARQAEWRDEHDAVLSGHRALQDPAHSRVEARRDIDLVVVDTPDPLHYYALFSVSHGYRRRLAAQAATLLLCLPFPVSSVGCACVLLCAPSRHP